MDRLWAHMKRLWPRGTLLPAAPFVLWCTYGLMHGEVRRWDLWFPLIGTPLLAYTNERTKRVLVGMYPVFLVGVLYDSMRFVQNVGLSASTVHTCDLRNAELALFGVGSGAARITIGEWLQAHSSLPLDALMSIPYGTYIFVALGYGLYLYFRDFTGLQRYAWSFLILNALGFLTYHIFPAAPPWYVHEHGCVVDLTTAASAGPHLNRIDALLGFRYFHGLYGRAHDVFGAIPSLHVTYPMLILMVGWRRQRWLFRSAAIVFFLMMCFGAIYLDHHWCIDVIVGLVYGGSVYAAVRWFFARKENHVPVAVEDDIVVASVGRNTGA